MSRITLLATLLIALLVARLITAGLRLIPVATRAAAKCRDGDGAIRHGCYLAVQVRVIRCRRCLR